MGTHLETTKLDETTRARLDAKARVIKALGHPTRLFLVEELARGERCVCDLTERVGADVSTVSKHLSVLRSTGLVTSEKRGTQVFYTLRCSCTQDFLDCVDDLLETVVRQEMKLIGA